MLSGTDDGMATYVITLHYRRLHQADFSEVPAAFKEACSQCCGSPDGRGVWGRMDAWIYVTESLCCSPEAITTLLISYISMHNKKLLKKKKEASCCLTRGPLLGCEVTL